jgi:hypothetical protein
MPGNLNERLPREHAKIPNVRNRAERDYGNRVGIWRVMEVLTRYGIRASAALNSEVCDHHPEIIEEANRRSDPANLHRDVRGWCGHGGRVHTRRSANASGPNGPANGRGASPTRSPRTPARRAAD